MNYLMVALGGMLGAVLRYLMFNLRLFKDGWFMYNTFLINVIGCFLIGILTEFFAHKSFLPEELRIFLIVGFLGAFTTFSTYGADVAVLMLRGENLRAATYILLSTVLGIAAVFGGIYLGKIFLK